LEGYYLKNFLCFLLLFLSINLQAGFLGELAFNYHSDAENADDTAYSRLDYRVYVAASFNQNRRVFFGQNIMFVNREMKSSGTGQTDSISVMELGPKLLLFFNESSTFGLALGWNPYAKGSRTRSGQSEDVSGSSMVGAIVVQAKVTKKFYVGASLNYHSLTITESTDSSNTQEDVSHTYTTMYPMFDLSFRF
jgi:hypothetical protein